MKIEIENLKFNTIIGILDFERKKEQEVIVNINIEYNYSNIEKNIIDYSIITKLIEEDMKNSKYFLIEEALTSLILKIKKKFQQIILIYIKISKPNIINNSIVSVSQKSK